MKIDNVLNTTAVNQVNLSEGLDEQMMLQEKTELIIKDKLDLSISGKARSQKIVIPVKKETTAGLVITDLQISQGNVDGKEVKTTSYTSRVSNEKAAIGASENRLGHNSPSIDKAPKE